jgi:AsmA protein
LRRILFALAALIIVGIGVTFMAPLFISTADLQKKALEQVESATGYRVRIDGPVRMAFFPSLDLVARDVGIAQPAAGGPAEFATARSLRFGLMLSGLLRGKVQLAEVTLIDPVIKLPLPKGAASEAAAPEGESGTVTAQDLSLEKLVIRNGTVILPSEGDKTRKRIPGLNLDASLPFARGPLSFDASGTYDGNAVKASGSIGSFGHFLSGGSAPIQLKIDAPAYLPAKADVAGTVAYKDDVLTLSQFAATAGDDSVSGNAVYKGDTLTLTKFSAKYQGAEVAGAATYADGAIALTNFTAKYQGLDLTGNGTYKDHVVVLEPITGTFDGHTASGKLRANLAGKVPSVAGALKTEVLDLNKLLPKKAGADAQSAKGGGWSDAKIEFSPLRKVNADLKLDFGKVTYDKIKVGPASLTAKLTGGKLTAEIPSLKLYGGGGSAFVVIDASGKVPAERVKLSLAKLDALPFLAAVADVSAIEGKAAIDLNLTASGASERAMVQTLNGTAKFAFTNGALRGLNVAGMLRNLTTGILTGWQVHEDEKTQFNTLGASFKIAKGQAQTDDLRLVGPLVSAGGAGTVDLPGCTLKFRVNPFMLASVKGQKGKNSMLGFPVPIAISGPWDNPSFYPDIAGILENPVAAYKQLDKLGGGLISMPANMLGIDTREGGLVEKSIAIPGAVTKGVVGGIGQLLGVKKKPKEAAPQEKTAPQAGEAAPSQATAQPAQQPAAQAEPKQQAAPQKTPQKKKSAPGQLLDGIFGN